MLENKLKALQYGSVDFKEDHQFRTLVKWIESYRIRHYKQDRPHPLNQVDANDWEVAWKAYLTDLGCPLDLSSDRILLVDWLLCQAVHLQHRHLNERPKVLEEMAKSSFSYSPADDGAEKSLAHLNVGGDDFKAGVEKLASLLSVGSHPSSLVTLQAVNLIVQKRLLANELPKVAEQCRDAKQSSLDSIELGFDVNGVALKRACKILRLLHVHQLRELQTRINAAIVSIQAITADPKTDERLGKVGF